MNKKRGLKILILSIILIPLFKCNNDIKSNNDIIFYVHYSVKSLLFRNYFIKVINNTNVPLILYNSELKLNCIDCEKRDILKINYEFDSITIIPKKYKIISLFANTENKEQAKINCNIIIKYKKLNKTYEIANKMIYSKCFKEVSEFIILNTRFKVCDEIVEGLNIKDITPM